MQNTVKTRFFYSTSLILISGLLFFSIYTLLVFKFRIPKNEDLISKLKTSNQNIEKIATELKQANTNPQEKTNEALNAIIAQTEIKNNAIDELKETETQINPEGLSLIQLLGGSAVLGLIGFLGLQRLQNIDTEIGQLRQYLLEQLKIQMSESRENLKLLANNVAREEVEKALPEEVEKRFRDNDKKEEQLIDKITKIENDIVSEKEHIEKKQAEVAELAEQSKKDAEEITKALERVSILNLQEALDVAPYELFKRAQESTNELEKILLLSRIRDDQESTLDILEKAIDLAITIENYTLALELYEKATAKDTNHFSSSKLLEKAGDLTREKIKDNDKALHFYKRAIEEDSRNVTAQAEKYILECQNTSNPEQEQAKKELIQLAQNNPNYRYILGKLFNFLIEIDHYQELIDIANELLTKTQRLKSYIWLNIANAQLLLNNDQEATKAYQNSLDLANEVLVNYIIPNDYYIHDYMRTISFYVPLLTKKSEFIEAHKIINNALKHYPRQPLLHRLKGDIYKDLGEYEKAKEWYQHSVVLAESLDNQEEKEKGEKSFLDTELIVNLDLDNLNMESMTAN